MKKSILSCLLALSCISASAQEQQPKTEYVFNPHWFVQIQPLGIQHTLGEIGFGHLNSYNLQVAAGRQFTPVVGARLAVNGWQSKGGSTIENKEYKWGWNYVAPSLDATFNLSNLLCGYNPTRPLEIGAFVGVGLNVAFSNNDAWDANDAILANYPNATEGLLNPLEYLWDGTKTRFFGRAGVTADYRINDAVSVGVEVSANTLSDKYNSKKAGNTDWYFNVLAGVKFNIGSTHTTRTIPVPEPEIRYVEKVVEKVVEKPAPVATAEVAKVEPLRRDIFFKINSSVISTEESAKVKDIADYLNKYPNAKVVLTGYADAGTGTAQINKRLSAQRADSVGKMLREKYQIAADRISYDSEGSTIQPFTDNDKNRVTICIAE